jgi:hypothetical protein
MASACVARPKFCVLQQKAHVVRHKKIVFEKNANFFAENWRKLAKIEENCDHNIDPRWSEILSHWRLFIIENKTGFYIIAAHRGLGWIL